MVLHEKQKMKLVTHLPKRSISTDGISDIGLAASRGGVKRRS
ncbi:hypothetical protein [Anaplasma phagocytophilum]|nr:hypothetical protein [Anaplasma phagocytophilum]